MYLNYPPKILKFRCLKWPERHKMVHHDLENILNFPYVKWPEMHLCCSPWLENILKFTSLKWPKMHLNCSPRLKKILKIRYLKWPIFHLFHTYSNNYKASSLWTIMETEDHYGNKDACPYHIICMQITCFLHFLSLSIYLVYRILFYCIYFNFLAKISILFQRIIKPTRQLTHSIY